MKSILKKIVLFLLKRMAKRRMRRFRGKVIGVTGSIGKTSTKDAIFKVLNSQFRVRRSKKSMNSDFGILLTILDIESGFSSAVKWSWYLTKGFFNSLHRDESEVLLLEYGVDAPGDMDFLLSVVKPDIAIVTGIAAVHMEEGQFASLKDIFAEKSKLALGAKEKVLLNIDDDFLAGLTKGFKRSQVLTYGRDVKADYAISRVSDSLEGMSFMLSDKEKRYTVETEVLGDYQAYVITPAVICGHLMGMEREQALNAVKRFTLPPGRMSVIEAIEGATILDSSYNASPFTMESALKVLNGVCEEKNRRVAVLGDMNELGENSAWMHKKIGEIVPKYADLLLTVGAMGEVIAEKALEKGMDEKAVHSFKNAKAAADFFREEIKKNDVVLVKGSQNQIRLERFVKDLMLYPEDAKKKLVRQDKVWQAKL